MPTVVQPSITVYAYMYIRIVKHEDGKGQGVITLQYCTVRVLHLSVLLEYHRGCNG